MTNPFHKYRQQVARAMCEEQSVQMDEPCYACDSGDCETLGLATAVLDALWSAMQAEGSVVKSYVYHSEPGKGAIVTNWKWEHPFVAGDNVLIIRTEPTA